MHFNFFVRTGLPALALLPRASETQWRRRCAFLAASLLSASIVEAGHAGSLDNPKETTSVHSPSNAQKTSAKSVDGRPVVLLNRFEFPRNVLDAPKFEKHLKRTLKKEARRVDWGGGRDNRIEYRFKVTRLTYARSDGALRIRCSAVGMLPGGKTAKSELSFGGDPSKRIALTKRVLDIVARGVVSRLAELERKRRGLL